MNHMSLAEWDRRVAPFLAVISERSRAMRLDAENIERWVKLLPVAPDFPTEAIDRLEKAHNELEAALNAIGLALDDYSKKERVS